MATTIPAPLSGKYALVTGASRGTGAAIALDLARKSCTGTANNLLHQLLCCGRHPHPQLRALGANTCIAIQADLVDPDYGPAVVPATPTGLQTSHTDIIVNNAAYMQTSIFRRARRGGV